MRRLRSALLLTGVAVLTLCGAAGAMNQCLQNARANNKACKSQCQDDFRADKFLCRNIDPACGLPCQAGRQACLDNVEAIKDTGVLPDQSILCQTTDASGTVLTGTDGCKTVLQEAKQTCGAPCPTPTPSTTGGETACQGCVDQAQVADFECRDACRDAFRSNTTVLQMQKNCRVGFQACIQQCPHVTPTPGT